MKQLLLTFILLITCTTTAWAQEVKPDSLSQAYVEQLAELDPDGNGIYCISEIERFKPQKLIAPAALLGVGILGVENGWFRSINRKVDEGMADWSNGRNTKIDDYLRFVPLAANLALYAVKAPVKYSVEERVVVRVTSYLSYLVLVGGLKTVIPEERPNNGGDHSFPSGHTSLAFLGAEHIRMEYGGWYGVGAYAVATTVGVMRMYNRAHWMTDVLAGAGVGVLCAHLGYWLLPLERKLFSIPTKASGNSFFAMPTYDARTNNLGFSLACTF